MEKRKHGMNYGENTERDSRRKECQAVATSHSEKTSFQFHREVP